jgi:competence protein ComEC
MAAFLAWWVLLIPVLAGFFARERRITLILFCAAVFGFLLRPDPTAPLIVEERHFAGEVVVKTIPRNSPFGMSAVAKGDQMYVLRLPTGMDVSMGDRLSLTARMIPLKEHHLRPAGAVAALQPVGDIQVLQRGLVVWRWGLKLRNSFVDFVDKHAAPPSVGVIEGLCFGVTSEILPDQRKSLQRSGAAHIVATSGLHVLLMSVGLAWLLMKLPFPLYVQFILLILILILYAGAAGMRAPIMRAMVMVCVLMVGPMLRRSPDGLSAVSLAGVLSLLLWPSAILEVGFWLSYAAVFGLILYLPLPEDSEDRRAVRVRKWIRSTAYASLIAFLATLPIVASVFGEVPLFGVVVNLLVLPVVPLVILVSLIGFGFSLFVPAVGGWLLANIASPLSGWILMIVESTGGQSWSAVSVPWIAPVWTAVFYLLAILIWRPKIREA